MVKAFRGLGFRVKAFRGLGFRLRGLGIQDLEFNKGFRA